MITRKPNKTESTFSTNKQVEEAAGQSIYQRNGLVKDIANSFYDIDYAVKWHIDNVIKCTIVENNTVIKVPVIFASGEKWAMIQKHGYLRDNQGKVLTPLIVIQRTGTSRREDLHDLRVLESPDNRIVFEKKYSVVNKYDRFSVTGKQPSRELYSVDIPKFIDIEYQLLIWVNNTIQLNEIVEQLLWFDGKAFGDTHKYITHIDPPSYESSNLIGEDRIIKAAMSMRSKGRILNAKGPNATIMYKLNPVERIIYSIEIDTGIVDTYGASAGQLQPGIAQQTSDFVGGTTSGDTGSSSGGGGAVQIDVTILTYLNASKQLTGTVISDNQVTFNSGWLIAPGGLPATSVDNFTFFVNGVLLEKSAIQSFSKSGSVSTLTINVSELGYSLSVTDEVIGIGKFINSDTLA